MGALWAAQLPGIHASCLDVPIASWLWTEPHHRIPFKKALLPKAVKFVKNLRLCVAKYSLDLCRCNFRPTLVLQALQFFKLIALNAGTQVESGTIQTEAVLAVELNGNLVSYGGFAHLNFVLVTDGTIVKFGFTLIGDTSHSCHLAR